MSLAYDLWLESPRPIARSGNLHLATACLEQLVGVAIAPVLVLALALQVGVHLALQARLHDTLHHVGEYPALTQ